MRLEYWQGSRRRPRVCGCGWWSAGPPCGGLAGLGAYLARRGRFRDRWRRFGWRLVLYLGRVPWRAFAARLRALWRGGWCWSVLAPCVALAGRVSLVLARSCWWRVALAAVAVWAAPVAAVAVAGAPVKRARRRWPLAGRWWRCAGCLVRLSKSGRGWRCWRCRGVCGGRGGNRTRAAVGGPPMVTALALAGRVV